MKSMFITFEGGEGTGKTTQVRMLSRWMEERNIPHLVTKEPGSELPECKKIREILLNPSSDVADAAELLLFLADRAQHVERMLRPALEAGKHVLCDRYTDSTRVYQGIRKLGRTKLDPLLEFATRGLMPDMTFIIDVPVEVGLDRAKGGGEYAGGDRMERQALEFHQQVRQGFLKLAESLSEQGRMVLVDAAPPRTIEQIHGEIASHVAGRLWSVADGQPNEEDFE
jgi:dTMP kinase